MENIIISANYLTELHKKDPGLIAIAETKNKNQVIIMYDKHLSLPQAFGQILTCCWLVEDVSETMMKIREQFATYRLKGRNDFYNLNSSEAYNMIDEIISEMQIVIYQGIRFRKKLHARWAAFFDSLEIPYEYALEPIWIGNQVSYDYQPDFYLPQHNVWMNAGSKLLNNAIDRAMAYDFVNYTGKNLFAFTECNEPVMSKDNSYMLHTGQYMTTEGEFDGSQTWELCENCEKFHILDMGIHENCETIKKEASFRMLGAIQTDPVIVKAFKTANLMFP